MAQAATKAKGRTPAAKNPSRTAATKATAAKTKAAPRKRAAKPKAGESAPVMTVKAACYAVLKDAGKPMHYREIADKVVAGDYPLRRRGGKTFPASVRTELAINQAMFEKVSPGTYRAI